MIDIDAQADELAAVYCEKTAFDTRYPLVGAGLGAAAGLIPTFMAEETTPRKAIRNALLGALSGAGVGAVVSGAPDILHSITGGKRIDPRTGEMLSDPAAIAKLPPTPGERATEDASKALMSSGLTGAGWATAFNVLNRFRRPGLKVQEGNPITGTAGGKGGESGKAAPAGKRMEDLLKAMKSDPGMPPEILAKAKALNKSAPMLSLPAGITEGKVLHDATNRHLGEKLLDKFRGRGFTDTQRVMNELHRLRAEYRPLGSEGGTFKVGPNMSWKADADLRGKIKRAPETYLPAEEMGLLSKFFSHRRLAGKKATGAVGIGAMLMDFISQMETRRSAQQAQIQ